jgi:hypothetical protein
VEAKHRSLVEKLIDKNEIEHREIKQVRCVNERELDPWQLGENVLGKRFEQP